MNEANKREARRLIQLTGGVLLIVAGSVIYGDHALAIAVGMVFMAAGVVMGLLAVVGKIV